MSLPAHNCVEMYSVTLTTARVQTLTTWPQLPLYRWLDPGAFGTLGVGGGFALGAKLVRPESEVWIVYGDGSLGYSVAEFDTFTRHKVLIWTRVGAIIRLLKSESIVNFNDSSLVVRVEFFKHLDTLYAIKEFIYQQELGFRYGSLETSLGRIAACETYST